MFSNKYKSYRLFNIFSINKKMYIPDDAPARRSTPVDDADVIGDGIRGIVVVLDEVVEVEFVGLDVD